MFTGEEIIKMEYPYELFKNDIEDARKQYVELLKIYNPKLNTNREHFIKITEKINNLYKMAQKQFNDGIWYEKGCIKIKTEDDREYIMTFRSKHTFNLGEIYIGDTSVLYLINEKYNKLINNALEKINNLKFTNDYMRKEFEKCLPRNELKFKTASGKSCVVFKKDVDLISLTDILDYYNGRLSVNYVISVLNNLYDLCCFMEFNKVRHNGISIGSYFISPKNKNGALIGGWWYATNNEGEFLDKRFNLDITYSNILNKFEINEDLKSIRYLGRVLLGDTETFIRNTNSEIPRALIRWVRGKAGNDTFYEYRKWKEMIREILYESRNDKIILDKEELYRKVGIY